MTSKENLDGIDQTSIGESAAPPGDVKTEVKGIVITSLAKLPEMAILDKKALAGALKVDPRTIQRMVGRYELPPPMSIAGRSHWMAGKVIAHFEREADRLAKKAEAAAKILRSRN